MPTADTKSSMPGLAVLFTAGFVTITTETLPLGLLPSMSRDIEVARSRIGLLVGVYALRPAHAGRAVAAVFAASSAALTLGDAARSHSR